MKDLNGLENSKMIKPILNNRTFIGIINEKLSNLICSNHGKEMMFLFFMINVF